MNQNQQHAFLKGKDITKYFKELRYGFSKSKIKKIIKNIYDIKKPKKIFLNQKWKRIEENLLELEKSLSKLKKYYDYDYIEYRRIKDVGNLFNQSIDKDYYKPIKTVNIFHKENNYIKYESNGDKNKNLVPTETLIWLDHI